MALKTEFVEQHEDGVIFYRKYSDDGKGILQIETGAIYDEVCVTDSDPYTYREIDIPFAETEEATVEDYEAALAELGVK